MLPLIVHFFRRYFRRCFEVGRSHLLDEEISVWSLELSQTFDVVLHFKSFERSLYKRFDSTMFLEFNTLVSFSGLAFLHLSLNCRFACFRLRLSLHLNVFLWDLLLAPLIDPSWSTELREWMRNNWRLKRRCRCGWICKQYCLSSFRVVLCFISEKEFRRQLIQLSIIQSQRPAHRTLFRHILLESYRIFCYRAYAICLHGPS